MFPYLKALHIIGVVCWFAGLFYIVRLFVYLAETRDRPEAEQAILTPQLSLMAKRLWFGITWPSAIGTVVFGLALLHVWWPPPLWLQIKLGLVVLLCLYHWVCHGQYKRLVAGEPAWTPRQYRM
jgi:putative membrane protein